MMKISLNVTLHKLHQIVKIVEPSIPKCAIVESGL